MIINISLRIYIGGWLATTIGAKWVYAGSLFTSSIATLALTIMYIMSSTHFSLIFALRFIVGLAHGVLFPSTIALWSLWAVPQERSTLVSIGFCGTHLGTSITMLVGGVLCRYLSSGWMYLFFLSGILGFVWLTLWILLTSDSPNNHHKISNHERDYICNLTGSTGKKRSMSLASIPWKNIVTSKPLIALFITHIANLFGLFFFLTNLGKILTELYRVPTQYTGYILAFGFFLTLVTSLSSGKD
jgi:MFS family permease